MAGFYFNLTPKIDYNIIILPDRNGMPEFLETGKIYAIITGNNIEYIIKSPVEDRLLQGSIDASKLEIYGSLNEDKLNSKLKQILTAISKNHDNIDLTIYPRLFFGEIFAVACAMQVNEDYCAYFEYKNETTQQQVKYFFSTIFGGRFITDKKKLNSKEQRAINISHNIIFDRLAGYPYFNFSSLFIKKFPQEYRGVIDRLLHDHLENTILTQEPRVLATFLSVRNSKTDCTSKNLTQRTFDIIRTRLEEQRIGAIVLIGDSLPDDINVAGNGIFIDFTRYDRLILAEPIIPPEALYLAQVFFLKRLHTRYSVNLAIGCPSGGAHMLGSLGIPVVFGDLNGRECSRFRDISYLNDNPLSLRNKSTFFPVKYPTPHDDNALFRQFEDELTEQLNLATHFPYIP